VTTLDTGRRVLQSAAVRLLDLYERYGFSLRGVMPKGLYARALLIIIVPMVVLQSVVAFAFMERHWNTVTQRLSRAVVQDISALIDVYTTFPQAEQAQLRRLAQEKLGLAVDFLPVTEMPPPGPKPFFSLSRSRRRSADKSGCRSGSTQWGARRWSRSGCGSTTR
jgi:two-component system osmolarity sensor histidine kinase EnvZ